ncbi:MAG TPA: TAXI family TRAP transporter solute-binding subunit [Kaistia sp.]|nr:TAXI family TRAP transporter solute-binding subunit [Kaistia sp.]
MLSHFKLYLKHDLKRELYVWSHIARYYWPLAAVVTLAAVIAFIYVQPFPRQETVLAVGQRGSMSEQLGEAFKASFEREGLPFSIDRRMGLDEVEKDLRDPASRVNASFVVSGAGSPADYPGLVSLGNVAIAPLWLFYRGDTLNVDDPFQYFSDKQIAVGAPGTVTRKLFTTLMELNNPNTGDKANFLKLPSEAAADALLAGTIDAQFVVDGYGSPIVQKLLHSPDIKLVNFPLVDAYVRQLPFLQKVTVPRGAIDIGDVRPESDIAMLASSVNLLVESDVHPTVQWAFLLAAREINLTSANFFPSIGALPQYKDRGFPLSEVAARFYTTGVPALFRSLPFRLAAILENVWVILFAVFLLVLPILKRILGYRGFASQKFLWLHFWELRYLEDELKASRTADEVSVALSSLRHLDDAAATTWVDQDQMRHYFNLRRCISGTIQDAEKKISALAAAPGSQPETGRH